MSLILFHYNYQDTKRVSLLYESIVIPSLAFYFWLTSFLLFITNFLFQYLTTLFAIFYYIFFCCGTRVCDQFLLFITIFFYCGPTAFDQFFGCNFGFNMRTRCRPSKGRRCIPDVIIAPMIAPINVHSIS